MYARFARGWKKLLNIFFINCVVVQKVWDACEMWAGCCGAVGRMCGGGGLITTQV